MYILEVISITKSVFKDNLTYFSKEPVECGAIVEVMVRKKLTPGLVVSWKEAGGAKLAIKKADYPLKKISGVRCPNLFRPELIEAMSDTALYFAAHHGQVLKEIVPNLILEHCSKIGTNSGAAKTTGPGPKE